MNWMRVFACATNQKQMNTQADKYFINLSRVKRKIDEIREEGHQRTDRKRNHDKRNWNGLQQ